MKRTEPFSFFALTIALLIHITIALILFILSEHLHAIITPEESKPHEERFRLSIKEFPQKPTKEAIVKNDIPLPPTKLPIPRGEQMVRPAAVPPPPRRSTSPTNTALSQSAVPVKPQTPVEPVPEIKKGFLPHTAPTVATIEKTAPKKESGLYDILSRPDGSAREIRTQTTTRVSENIQRLYGDKFNDLSEGEQKYIIDNQEVMRRITQDVLDRYGHSKIPDSIRTNDTNMIEFYLHPDGSISDLHFLKNSQLAVLDDTTRETIQLAYAKYPRPQQKTLIRYRVYYNLSGY
ncbi:MAG: energy transducer TonB [Sulfuricurvum sp.]